MKGTIYGVAIATVIFSRVKITCYFHIWRYHVLVRKLTWYFIGVYTINKIMFYSLFHWHGCVIHYSWFSKPKYSFIFFTPIIPYVVFITHKKTRDAEKLLGSIITSCDVPKRETLEAVLMWSASKFSTWKDRFFKFLIQGMQCIFYI